jgi:hypothetical protein
MWKCTPGCLGSKYIFRDISTQVNYAEEEVITSCGSEVEFLHEYFGFS